MITIPINIDKRGYNLSLKFIKEYTIGMFIYLKFFDTGVASNIEKNKIFSNSLFNGTILSFKKKLSNSYSNINISNILNSKSFYKILIQKFLIDEENQSLNQLTFSGEEQDNLSIILTLSNNNSGYNEEFISYDFIKKRFNINDSTIKYNNTYPVDYIDYFNGSIKIINQQSLLSNLDNEGYFKFPLTNILNLDIRDSIKLIKDNFISLDNKTLSTLDIIDTLLNKIKCPSSFGLKKQAMQDGISKAYHKINELTDLLDKEAEKQLIQNLIFISSEDIKYIESIIKCNSFTELHKILNIFNIELLLKNSIKNIFSISTKEIKQLSSEDQLVILRNLKSFKEKSENYFTYLIDLLRAVSYKFSEAETSEYISLDLS